ncbi:acid protease [Aaosphaeria arxii CBS 175.79]|uniref:Acid protease n=1 Tax=Aaosphaeria arxii CBS 175.79 TaxID=1450172 RepID=A0A6A5XY84_9PLEO|nr:acid protease [Aaosphaeria arxii CBS 175.79]KAF2017234.1 acid protease [Aaosphaeria arxii CBS 175.79]
MRAAQRAEPSTIPEPYVVPTSGKFDGNDGNWSTFKINIGTPGQDFRVLASTQSGQAFVVVPDGCLEQDGADCPNLRGAEIFQSSQSPGFRANNSKSWSQIGIFGVDLEERLNINITGQFGYDNIALGDAAAGSEALALDRQVVTGIAEMDYFLGHIPLGITKSSFNSLGLAIDSFIYQLREQSKIPSISFAYTAGARYRLKSVFGSLIFGGYDSTRFEANDTPFSFTFSTDPSRLLTVGVESITATNTLDGTSSLSSSYHFSLIDSTVSHLWLPEDICDNFAVAFGLTYDNRTQLYTVNDTIHEQLTAKNPSVTIKLVNSMQDSSVNFTNIVLPYAAFDLQASYPYYDNATNYFPIRRATSDKQYVLGRAFLQEAYLIVDYERANFTVAQAAFPDPLPAADIVTIKPPSNSTSTTSPSSSGSSLSTGAIVGIAVGGAAVLIILGVVAFFFVRRKRRRAANAKYELENTQLPGSTPYHDANSHKNPLSEPQEISGTPLTELASPLPRSDPKPFYSPTDVLQEMDATPLVPATPRWEEVTAGDYHEMDTLSPRAANETYSRAPSEDGRQSSTGISPMTPSPRIDYQYHRG